MNKRMSEPAEIFSPSEMIGVFDSCAAAIERYGQLVADGFFPAMLQDAEQKYRVFVPADTGKQYV